MLYKKMGVINITPDSFSDGGQANQIDSFKKAFIATEKWADIIDIGAESTAPMNQKVKQADEMTRYESIFFPFLSSQEDFNTTISIDTYKIDTFKYVYAQIKKYWPQSKIIFNDVSGKIDDALISLLSNKAYDFKYVFSHNLSPHREETTSHMKYVKDLSEYDFLTHLTEYFLNQIDKFSELERIIIDPCFGFSKSREQNHQLLRNFKTFLLQIPYQVSCLYGVSRKSFLRIPKDLDIKDEENLKVLEQMQAILFYDLIKEPLERELIFRTHTPNSFQAAENIKKIFDV